MPDLAGTSGMFKVNGSLTSAEVYSGTGGCRLPSKTSSKILGQFLTPALVLQEDLRSAPSCRGGEQ